MSAKTFGTTDGKAEFAAKYGSTDYAVVGAAIRQEQFDAKYREVVARFTRPTPAVILATPRAVKCLVDMWLERSDKATREQVQAWAEQQDRETVSAKIEWLKTQPRRAAYPDVPAGRYAVTGDNGQTVFLKVDRPTEGPYKGKTFVSIQAGDELHKALGASVTLLRKILADGAKAASIRYGKELQKCGVCNRSLTVKASRDAGIGPKCATMF